MFELLFEIFSEEIPACVQLFARQALFDMAKKDFEKAGIQYSKLEAFITPRRLVLVAENVKRPVMEDKLIYKKGPRIDESKSIIQEFARSMNVAEDDLIIKKIQAKEYFFAKIKQQQDSLESSLQGILERFMHEFSWPKSMRWEYSNITWIRPIRNLLCLYNGNVLPVKYGNLVANDLSFGHRSYSGSFKVTEFKSYLKSLKRYKVILSTQERKEAIQSAIDTQLLNLKARLVVDEGLLDEIAGLVEYPNVLLGRMDESFLNLPKEVVISVMRTHQKYFAVENDSGELLPYFIVVANLPAMPSRDKTIIKGNQRVLAARLFDAQFLFNEDRKLSLEARVPALHNLLFFKDLGTMLDKVQRMVQIIHTIVELWDVKIVDLAVMERAAYLCKVDLLTNLVKEFPELQGIVGSYYAGLDGESEITMRVIYEHYLPRGKDDEYPETVEGSLLSVADKLDSLVGLFFAGEIPTSSKDPYALRRSALGIVKILCSFDITINIGSIIQSALSNFTKNNKNLVSTMMEFLYGRFRILWKNNFKSEIIEAVLKRTRGNIAADYRKIVCLQAFISSEECRDVFFSIKRVLNITNQSSNGHGTIINTALFNQHEKDLYETFIRVNSAAQTLFKNFLYEEIIDGFSELSEEINAFFDHVLVIDDNPELRKNRLALLREIATLFLSFADFSLINI